MREDLRFDVPLFTISDAARHLGLARSTLQSWTTRWAGPAHLVHRLEPETPRGASVPFIAMVEAHMLRGLKELGLTPHELWESVSRLRRDLGDEYVLATRRVATDGRNLLVDMADSFENPKWERARDGQRIIDDVIQRYLSFVRWSEGDRYPLRLKLRTYEGADVMIDPRFAFGQPVLETEKIRVEDILDAFWAGESAGVIADEFGTDRQRIEAVIRSATRPHAA